MRLSPLLIGTLFLAIAPAALGSDPCSPRTLRPYHVSAFASASPDDTGSGSVTPMASYPAGSELQLQADCLVWEASLSPKAEFLGVALLAAPVPSGPYRPQIGTPDTTVRIVLRTSGVPLGSSSPAASLFEATSGTSAFTLGASLIPAR